MHNFLSTNATSQSASAITVRRTDTVCARCSADSNALIVTRTATKSMRPRRASHEDRGRQAFNGRGRGVDRAPWLDPPQQGAPLTGPQNPTETDPRVSQVTHTQKLATNGATGLSTEGGGVDHGGGGRSNGPYADSLPLSDHFQGGGGGAGSGGGLPRRGGGGFVPLQIWHKMIASSR